MHKKNKKSKSSSKRYNKEKIFNNIYNNYFNKNQNEILPLVQKENNGKRIRSEANNFNSFRNNNKAIKKNDNNPSINYPITSEFIVKKEDVRKISERLYTFKRPFNQNIIKNNNEPKLKRISSGNKILKYYKNFQNYYRKESTDNLIKRKDELGNKNEEKEIKIKKLEEDNHNNKEDEKYGKKVLLKETEGLKQEKINIEKENDLKNQKDPNKIKSLKEKLSEIGKENKELKENQEKINLLKKENATREQSEIEEKEKVYIKDSFNKKIKLKYSYNPKNSSFEEIERKKFNQSMELANSRYPQNIINLENENDVNHLLNNENSSINRLMNNKKENHFLSQSEKEAYPNISKLKYIKNILINVNEKNRIENTQKKKDELKYYFNNRTTRNAQEHKDNDNILNLREKRGFFLDNKNLDKKDEKVPLKENNCTNFKELNSYEMDEKIENGLAEDIKKDEEKDLNLVFNLENDKINDKKKKETAERYKLDKTEDEKTKKINNILENINNNKDKSEENAKNVILKKESEKNNEELKLNEKEIERLEKEKSDLMLKNKELNKENEKMKQKLQDNNNLILKNEEEKEIIKKAFEKQNNDLENIKKKI